jgi:hypothetical protein
VGGGIWIFKSYHPNSNIILVSFKMRTMQRGQGLQISDSIKKDESLANLLQQERGD